MKKRFLIVLLFQFLVAGCALSEEVNQQAISQIEEANQKEISQTGTPASEKPEPEETQEESLSYEAEPLPNSVNISGLSLSLYSMKREDNKTEMKFLVRKISSSGDFSSRIGFELVDDHGNIYEYEGLYSYICHIGPGMGREVSTYGNHYRQDNKKISALPVGFTWVETIVPFNIPDIAPLIKLNIKKGGLELGVLDISAFKPTQVSDFHSQMKDYLTLPYKITQGEYITAVMQKMRNVNKEGKDYVVIPITVKNTDYKDAMFSLGSVGLQAGDGEVWWGYYKGLTLPSAEVWVTIPGLSEETVEVIAPMEKVHYTSSIEGCKAMLFTNLPGRNPESFTILKITSDNFE